ncbi:hypothetical protein RJ492_002311 [Pluralibacter gergoviae]|uniref:Uncharacterized protein n=1 Tax=Pluralibacter gergoviae TaxID=61647 RepID=A0AAI9DJG9_PLUGE|nr:hypothetical protein [Pluralibacter gergoviae]EKV0914741.1 hypothetical protein [Pluralibacter gergoviae]EKV9907537.1 hypothetical protein [Pluralibacter gergoviae]EKW7272898.1 hypothetical protein [Pluralibacter gergoviae]ELC3073088.1 hypothetical protein [Pluralibacter gergoviae]ELD4296135.1 hypothetical protein [Pluralibacter gergoviae]
MTVTRVLEAMRSSDIPVRDDRLRTLSGHPTPAAPWGRSEAYSRTWHLPCDDERYTYARLTALPRDAPLHFDVELAHRQK